MQEKYVAKHLEELGGPLILLNDICGTEHEIALSALSGYSHWNAMKTSDVPLLPKTASKPQ